MDGLNNASNVESMGINEAFLSVTRAFKVVVIKNKAIREHLIIDIGWNRGIYCGNENTKKQV
jgi:hypothetical protein